MTDSEKLINLAEWFDLWQGANSYGGTEVQDDLKRIAKELETFKEFTVDKAAIVALNLAPSVSAQEQAMFIAGFIECVKYINTKPT